MPRQRAPQRVRFGGLGSLALALAGGVGGAWAQRTPDGPAVAARQTAAQAQRSAAAQPSAWRTATGRVLLASGTERRPVAGQWVTLHRVGRDSSGPVDSVRTTGAGAFAIRYRPFGDTTALYFAATPYAGVAYYAVPAHGAGTRAQPVRGDIVVYDTTSARDGLRVESRHLVVGAPGRGGVREVNEGIVVSNTGDKTVVSAGGATVEVALPSGATDLRAENGDVSGEAITFAPGVVRVVAPIAPGTKRIAISYHVPDRSPIRPGAGPAGTLELLIEDSAAVVHGAGVAEDQPVPVAGRVFRRFLATDVADASALEIVTRGSGRRLPLSSWMVLVAALAMAAAFVGARRRATLATPSAAA